MQLPAFLPDYKIKRQIASDETRNIYLGHHVRLQKDVLIEIIDGSQLTEIQLRQLKRAYQHAKKISHPLAIKYHKYVNLGEKLLIIKEFYPYKNLCEILKRHELKLEDICWIVKELLAFISDLHSRNLVFLAFYPENILFDLKTKSLKIRDFSFVADMSSGNLGLIFDKKIESFIAPELKVNASLISKYSDYFGLGKLALYLIEKARKTANWKGVDRKKEVKISEFIGLVTKKDPQTRDINSIDIHTLFNKDKLSRKQSLSSLLSGLINSDSLISRENEYKQIKDFLLKRREERFLFVYGESGVGKSFVINKALSDNLQPNSELIFKFNYEDISSFNMMRNAFGKLTGQLKKAKKNKIWLDQVKEASGSFFENFLYLIKLRDTLPTTSRLNLSFGSQNKLSKGLSQSFELFFNLIPPSVIIFDDIQWCKQDDFFFVGILLDVSFRNGIPVIAISRNKIGHPALNIYLNNKLKKERNLLLKLPINRIGTDDIIKSINVDRYSSQQQSVINKLIASTNGNMFHLKLAVINMSPSGDNFQISLNEVFENEINFRFISYAAIFGTIFSASLVKKASNIPDADNQKSLEFFLKYKIIEKISEGNYTFSHDKFRELVLAKLSDRKREEIAENLIDNIPSEEYLEKQAYLVSYISISSMRDKPKNKVDDYLKVFYGASLISLQNYSYSLSLKLFEEAHKLYGILGNKYFSSNFRFIFFKDYAELLYLIADYTKSIQICQLAWRHARTSLQKATLLRLIAGSKNSLGLLSQSIDYGLKALAYFGIKLAKKSPKIADAEFAALISKLKQVDNLLEKDSDNLEEVSSLVAQLLVEIAPAAYNTGNKRLLERLIISLYELSIKYNIKRELPYSIVCLAMVLSEYGKYSDAYKLGKKAISLVDETSDHRNKARTYYMYAMFVQCWNEHISKTTDSFEKAINFGIQSGETYYTAYSCYASLAWNQLFDIDFVISQYDKYLEVCKKTGVVEAIDRIKFYKSYLNYFSNSTNETTLLQIGTISETHHLKKVLRKSHVSSIGVYYLLKTKQAFLSFHYENAYSYIIVLEKYKNEFYGLMRDVEYHLYKILSFVERKDYLIKTKGIGYIIKIFDSVICKFQIWSSHCPGNFEHLYNFCIAEKENLLGNHASAYFSYLKALEYSSANNYPFDLALITLRFGKSLIGWQAYESAGLYLAKAMNLFKNLGYRFIAENINKVFYRYISIKNLNHISLYSNAKEAKYLLDNIYATKDIEVIYKKVLSLIIGISGADLLVHLNLIDENKTALYSEAEGVLSCNKLIISKWPPMEQAFKKALEARRVLALDELDIDVTLLDIGKGRPRSAIIIPVHLNNEITHAFYIQNNNITGLYNREFSEYVSHIINLYFSVVTNYILHSQKLLALETIKENVNKISHLSKFIFAGELLASLAHEVNQPLSSVIANLSGIKNTLSSPKNNINLVPRIEKTLAMTELAGQIIHRYKKLFKKETGEFRVENILSIINDVLDILDHKLKNGKIGVQLKSIRQEYFIKCDRVQLHQLFINLIMNSIDSLLLAEKKDKIIFIELDDSVDKNCLIISYLDNGIGIPVAMKGKLFKPFETTKEEGCGLGMAICKTIVEMHKGKIEHVVSYNEGAKFSIRLPITG